MRYRFLFLLLILGLSACTFQVDVLTPEPSTNVSSPTADLIATATSFPLTSTPPPSPTFAFAPTIVPSPLPANDGTYPIRFAANGTYSDVADGMQAGSSKTYSVSALKGQVMSVSVDQSSAGDWVYIPIEMVGRDNTTLCPATSNSECTFWRGILPSTQEYLIKLKPVNAANFTLRVAINPPGAATQTFQYLSQNGRASFSYIDEFAPMRFPGAAVTRIAPEISLNLVDIKSYSNTNLIEAYFLFGSSNVVSAVQHCTEPISFGGPENMLGEETVNGVKFIHSQGGGVAAGNTYEQTYYRAAYQDVCYEITFFVHYANIGAYAPDSGVKEFDRAALLQKFATILSTLIIK